MMKRQDSESRRISLTKPAAQLQGTKGSQGREDGSMVSVQDNLEWMSEFGKWKQQKHIHSKTYPGAISYGTQDKARAT
jgi:hypothetical protein